MSTSGIADIDPKTQGPEVEKLKKFLGESPQAEYSFDTSQPDKLEAEICRLKGQERNCMQLKISSKQMLNQMQKLDYFCSLPHNPGKTELVCKKVIL